MPVGQGARNNILLGGLGRPNLFDTNVKATSIDEDIFSDQTEVTSAADGDLVLILDVSETPDEVKFITKDNLIGSGLVTINNNADNRVTTGTGTALNGEANLLFDGTILTNDGGEINLDISGGDPHFSFQIGGTDKFTLGVDDDDSDKFKIDTGGTVGGATKITLDSSGNVTIAGDLTVSGDDLFMGTNTDGMILVADGTNFNPVQVSGDVEISNSGATTIQADSVESGMLNDNIISGQTEITSGLAAEDELLYSDGGTLKRVGLDNLVSKFAGTNLSDSSGVLNVDDAFLVNNADDTTSGVITSAGYKLNVADSSGDVVTEFQQGGTTAFTIGIDDSDSNLFKIHSGTALADDSDLELDTSGNLNIKNGVLTLGSVSNAGTDTDKFLVLDGSGNVDFRTGAEVASDIGAGAGVSLTNDADNRVVTANGSGGINGEANLSFDGTDLALFKDSNNADVSFALGTASAESLTIQVLNGGSNKTAEEVHFSTATASSTANHGKMVFDIDGSDIMEINDSGINIAGSDGVDIATGAISIKNSGTQSYVRFYCEVSNAHYTQLQSAAHSDYSGNVTITLPVSTDTLVGRATTDTLTNKSFGDDVDIFEDANNADVTLRMGTSATESLAISVLNGASNKSAESVTFTTATAASGSDAGKFTFNVDGTDIFDIDDSGINLTSGKTFRINGSALPSSVTVTALNNATENELVTIGSTTTELDAETALTFDGTDLKLLKDANNADVSFVLGTADAESLTIQVLNGDSNKTAEEVHFSTATASGTANHGKMVFDVDGTDILTIDDGGIDVASGKTIAIDGTDIVSATGAITGITSLLATDIKIGEDDQTKIDFETADEIHFYVANAHEITLAANEFSPNTSDGIALGTGSKMWSDLFLASGSVVNFNNGDVTLTHSANTLTVAGGTLAAAAITGTTGTFSGVLKTDDTTAATSTTDGSLQTDGGLSVVGDAVIGDDLFLLSDDAVIHMGADSDVTITHDPDDGLFLKSTATADNNPFVLTLQTGETDIAADDVIGAINFQAPDEGTGTDAILIAAGIEAVSEGDFAADNNATKLSFKTGASEAAAEKMSLSSAGLLTIADDLMIKDGGTIGVASTNDAITISSAGIVTFKDDVLIKDGGTIGNASVADVMTLASTGVVTFKDDIIIKDGGTIGSASDTDAISISSGGVVAISATTANTDATDGALTVAGGASVAADLTVGDDLRLLTDSAVLSLGADSDATLTHDGTTGLTIAANPITLDSGADIVFDAAGNDFNFKASGTEVLRITNSSSDVIIRPVVDAKDLIFQQRDGTEVARVEDNGTFNIVTDKLAINGTAVTATAAELNLLDGGTSVGGSITLADSDGVVVNDGGTMKTIPASDVKTYAAGSAATKGFATAMAIAL